MVDITDMSVQDRIMAAAANSAIYTAIGHLREIESDQPELDDAVKMLHGALVDITQ